MESENHKTYIKALRKRLRGEAVLSFPAPPAKGGQSVGRVDPTVILTSDELSFRIEIGWHRSRHLNIDTAYLLFELFLDDVIK